MENPLDRRGVRREQIDNTSELMIDDFQLVLNLLLTRRNNGFTVNIPQFVTFFFYNADTRKPRSRIDAASPSVWVPVAQAVTIVIFGPKHWNRSEIR